MGREETGGHGEKRGKRTQGRKKERNKQQPSPRVRKPTEISRQQSTIRSQVL